MKIAKLVKQLSIHALLLIGVGLASTTASATIFLLGTDDVGYHADLSFNNAFINELGANDASKSILFLNNQNRRSINYTGPRSVAFKPYAFLHTANLADYSAVYVDAPGACCSDPGSSLSKTDASKVSAFVMAGGNLGVGDYAGNKFWDAALGFVGSAGVLDTSTCIDPGVSTPAALALGFAASYTDSCFAHQKFDPIFWQDHGYIALQETTDGKFLTMQTVNVPEPATVALLSLGLLGFAAARRKSAK